MTARLFHHLLYLIPGPLAWLHLRGFLRLADYVAIRAQLAFASDYIVNGRGVLAEFLRGWQRWWES